ncbi:MAG: nodulation protein NfeD [Candidatus Bathyarchaeia archaeon]
MNRRSFVLVQALLCNILITVAWAQMQPATGRVVVVEVKGLITSATSEKVEEALKFGIDLQAEAIIIILDTPGGQLDATMRIVEAIERSRIPVISFVYPIGAKAWSAGTIILIGSHIAAMAPHTIMGSAQPVSYSPLGGSEPVTEKKVLNAVSTFIVERARMHNRNETAARLFVEENLNLNSEDAHRLNVVDVLASDLNDLLSLIDGRVVSTAGGQSTLKTRFASIVDYSPSLRVSILTAISNPILAYLLFALGIYALIFGLATPGYGGEVIGAVALLTGLIGLGFDLNLGGLLILGLGALLMIAEAYTAGFGILGGAGIFCLILGGLLLLPYTSPKWLIAPEWYSQVMSIALGVLTVLGIFTLIMIYKILQARRRKPVMGGLIGIEVYATEDIENGKTGFVRYMGEYWKARATERVGAGEKALVIGKDGPILIIRRAQGRDEKA